jgi:hypothetical protein
MKRFIAFIFIAMSLICVSVFAQDSNVRILSLPTNARAAAMADTFCAISGDCASLSNNPAGLAACSHTELFAGQGNIINDIKLQNFGIVYPLTDFKLSNLNSLGTLAGSYTTLDPGYSVLNNNLTFDPASK